ncbi:WD repeat-containing protein 76-like isoform X1 [Daphnia pulex]|uniref:WD repeat-containing protein 76-like isoform X1 n=1 Tax=Daphnia pulex TaxID=6669 RepID=UPI001EE052CE|nr:WD repeat-containing protein 76-like isoform X1 [Daphnia pulex]
MQKRSSTFADMSLVNSAPNSSVDSSPKKKPLIGKHLTLLQPYVRVERLDQETLRRLLPVRKAVEDQSESSEESVEKNESECSAEELAEENESESSEESAEENETPVKQNKTSERKTNAKANSEMSEYEKQIQRNIEENEKMFQQFIGGAKKGFMKVVPKKKFNNVEVTKKKKRRWYNDVNEQEQEFRAVKRLYKQKDMNKSRDLTSISRSLRARKTPLPIQNYNELLGGPSEESSEESSEGSSDNSNEYERPVYRRKTEVDEATEIPSQRNYIIKEWRKRVDLVTLADAKLKHKSIVDSKFIKEMIPLLEKEGELEELPVDQQDFLKLMKSFSIHEKGVAKISQTDIKCLAWHPSNYKLLVAVGDRYGNIGFWDIDKLDDKYQGVRAFNKVHTMPINCITFDASNRMRLITSGDDYCLRSLDLHSNVCEKIFHSSSSRITDHAQKNRSTFIVAHKNAVVIDTRTGSCRIENTIKCFDNITYTISLHPQDENLFMACGRTGEIGIFDMRYTATNAVAVPVVSFPEASKRINGASFSPITGNFALTTGADDTITLYDVQKGESEPECIKSIHHNNYVGRFLAPFKANWHPQREDVFIVGSGEDPSRVELYGAPSCELLHTFEGDVLDSMTSLATFHPTLPVFASCNLSQVHIFRP